MEFGIFGVEIFFTLYSVIISRIGAYIHCIESWSHFYISRNPYHRSRGHTIKFIGAAWAVGILVQILMFHYADRAIREYNLLISSSNEPPHISSVHEI
jgi:hypothetical protein